MSDESDYFERILFILNSGINYLRVGAVMRRNFLSFHLFLYHTFNFAQLIQRNGI